MTPDALRRRLAEAVLVIDGGLSTELERRGSDTSGPLWSARVLRDDPRRIVEAQAAFIAAGADVVITASYQVSRRGLLQAGGTAAEADSLLSRSVDLAREAADGAEGSALVAASVGPYGATNHDGSEYRGRYGVTVEALADFHRERLEPLLSAEPDLIAVETIPDLDEVEAIALVLGEHPSIASWVSMTTGDGRTLCAGQPLMEAARVLASVPSVAAIGVNCSAPGHVGAALRKLATGSPTGMALLAYPNAGQTWDASRREWSGTRSAASAAELAVWAAAGARAVGGCCGVDSDGIRDLSALKR